MAEADTELLERIQIDKPYRLLGFESAKVGFDQLEQEVSGTLEMLSDEIIQYLEQRTAHIDDEKDRKMAMDHLETRIRIQKMRQQS